jgi:hypothetical protein
MLIVGELDEDDDGDDDEHDADEVSIIWLLVLAELLPIGSWFCKIIGDEFICGRINVAAFVIELPETRVELVEA